MIRVFIGFDANETVAYHVLSHSIMRHASVPVSITPLILSQLPLTRARDPKQSTDFAFSRFLVPWLCGYEGRAIFMDCDMLCRADIATLQAQAGVSVSVVQHDYTPKDGGKFLGQQQTAYQRKNWSSVMAFDNTKCRPLTPDYVNGAAGLDLHQFKWTYSVGTLDPTWNHLVGEYVPNTAAKLVHFTLGTPCFSEYANCEYAKEWHAEKFLMLHHKEVVTLRKREKAAA